MAGKRGATTRADGAAAAPRADATASELGGYRGDGWANVLTGLGRAGTDKRVSTRFEKHDELTMDRLQLEAMFEQDDLARFIVEHLPQEMMREWMDVRVDENPVAAELAQDELARLGARKALFEGMLWGRLYGGGLVMIGADDGQPFDMPLNLRAIRKVHYLQAMDRWHATPEGWVDDPSHPMFFQPEFYLLRTGVRVHASRMIRFDGALIPADLYRSRRWHNSVLEAPHRVMMGYSAAMDGVTTALFDLSINVLAQKGLADAVARKGPEYVAKRAAAAQLTMSMMRMMLIDADGERFDRMGQPLAGVSDVFERVENRMARASGYPKSILFGTQQGKLAGSETDLRIFYDGVAERQKSELVPATTRVLETVFAAREGPFKGQEPGSWALAPRALWRPTDEQTATTRNKNAQTDKLYVDMGVVSKQEVRESRFGGAEYSAETVLDPTMDAVMGQGEPDDEDDLENGGNDPDPENPDDPKRTVPGENAPEPDAEG